jgi:hypothetical protein
MARHSAAASSLHGAVAAAEPGRRLLVPLAPAPRGMAGDVQDGIGMQAVSNNDLQLGDGSKPSYRFWVRLGRKHTVVARCSWCTMPNAASGKPFMQDGRPYDQECREYRQ